MSGYDESEGNDLGGGGGGIGLLGLLGLKGLKGVKAFKAAKALAVLSPILGPLLPIIALPLLLLAAPLLLGPLLPIIAPVALAVLAVGILFLPIPVVTIPGRRSASPAAVLADAARNALESSMSEDCAERITCEISKAAKTYGVEPPWVNNMVEKSSSKSKWLERISRAYKTAECGDYQCGIVNSFKKILNSNP
jgi:hypothetical protein